MVDLSGVNMEGVEASGEPQGLPAGQYFIRIEGSECKAVKDKFLDNGQPHEGNGKNHYLQILVRVYGGPNDQHAEYLRFNLWNINEQAVNIGKREWKAVQDACSHWSSNSDEYHGRFMILEVKPGIKDPTKLYNKYSAAPQSMVDAYRHLPPVGTTPPSAQAALHTQSHVHAGHVPASTTPAAPYTPAAAPPVAQAGTLPSWAQPKK